jgi:hypothetical protein
MKSIYRLLCLLSCLSSLGWMSSCTSSQSSDSSIAKARKDTIENIAEEYFETYANREDWESFLSFYAEDLKFEDAILQVHLDSLEAFKAFYDWPNPGFRKHPDYPEIFKLEDLVVDDSTAVGRGVFHPFYWQDTLFRMEWDPTFTIWLWFDDSLKIHRQVDWVEYSGNVLMSVGERIEKGDY